MQLCGNGWTSLGLTSRTTRRLIRGGGLADRLIGRRRTAHARGDAPCCTIGCKKEVFFLIPQKQLTVSRKKKERKSRTDPTAAQETLEAQFVKFTLCRVTGCITPVSSRARLPPPPSPCVCMCVRAHMRKGGRGILCVHVGNRRRALQLVPDKIKKLSLIPRTFLTLGRNAQSSAFQEMKRWRPLISIHN